MKRFGIVVIVIIAVGYSGVLYLRGPGREFTEKLLSETPDTEDLRGPSFTADADRDGLSDAKEAIYGTNAARFDTDGDGFSDGEEVYKGFDPTVPGEGKITDNESLMANLTVRYFEWARAIAGVEDPQLNDAAIARFLELEGLLEPQIPVITDEELTPTDATGPEALRAYFDALAQVQLPDATGSYIDLADEVIREKQSDILDEVILGLGETYEAFRAIPAPVEVYEIHREQLSLIKAIRNLFADLYSIGNDPVLLLRDIVWGNALLKDSVELEKRRRDLAATILPEEPSESANGKESEEVPDE